MGKAYANRDTRFRHNRVRRKKKIKRHAVRKQKDLHGSSIFGLYGKLKTEIFKRANVCLRRFQGH